MGKNTGDEDMIILFTSKNIASANIAKQLMDWHGFAKSDASGTWELDGVRLIDTKAPSVLEVPTDFETDLILVLSTHRSKVPGKMLTAHIPGNWDKAEMGGRERTLNIADAVRLKRLLIALKREGDGIGWPVSLEADHHGPTCGAPIIFVEIGNGEGEWADEDAARAVANAVMELVAGESEDTETEKGGPPKRETRNPKPETVFGAGCGHYPRLFSRLELESDYAFGHMAPKYAIDAMDEEMFRQAIEKNVERATKVIISKDETNLKQKEKMIGFANRYGIGYELL